MVNPKIECETCSTRAESVFCDLNAQHLHNLNQAKTTNTYKAHQILFYEGNDPYGLYCISSGRVKIYKMDAEGHQKILRLAGPGDILGYRCLLSDGVYSSTAETIEAATICFIDRGSFLRVLKEDPVASLHVMKVLSEDLNQAETQTLGLVHRSMRERLAELLLTFKTKYGKKEAQGISLEIDLTRSEMASLVGITQESMIRLISDFKKEDLIAVDGRSIVLKNLPALIEAANLVD